MTSWFDESPETYHRARPSYPEALWDELFARLPARPRLLEIGPGTGKATAALLARGASVVACEPGPNLARFLGDRFASHSLEVLRTTFEAADLATGTFDGVVAATSFHWVDPAVRASKPATILRPGGVLAIVSTNQVSDPVDRGYFAASEPIYREYFPGETVTSTAPDRRDVTPPEYAELSANPRFGAPSLHRYDWDQRYTTAQYLDLVRSYSNTARLPLDSRRRFLDDLEQFIDATFDGYVVRPLVMALTCATSR